MGASVRCSAVSRPTASNMPHSCGSQEEQDTGGVGGHHQHIGTPTMTAAVRGAAEVCRPDRGLAGEEGSLTCWTLQTAATTCSSICSRCRAPFWGVPWSTACCSLALMPPSASQQQ